MKKLTLIHYIATMAGIGCIIVGILILNHKIVFLNSAVSTAGKVLDVAHTSRSGRHSYKATIEFKTITNTSIEFIASSGDSDAYKTGDVLEVLYQEIHPEKAIVKSFSNLWSEGFGLIIFGLIFSAPGLYAIRYWYIRGKQEGKLLKYLLPFS